MSSSSLQSESRVKASWNVTAYAQKLNFVFRRNGRVHFNRRGRQFSRLLAAEVCASAVVMLDTPCFEVVWRVLVTHSIRQSPLHFLSRESPCAITFQLESTSKLVYNLGTARTFLCWPGRREQTALNVTGGGFRQTSSLYIKQFHFNVSQIYRVTIKEIDTFNVM